MKKTYIQPATEVTRLNACQPMLTTSIPLSDTGTDVQFTREDLSVFEDESSFDFDEENEFGF